MVFPKSSYKNITDYANALVVQAERKHPQVDWSMILSCHGVEELERRIELFEENFDMYMN